MTLNAFKASLKQNTINGLYNFFNNNNAGIKLNNLIKNITDRHEKDPGSIVKIAGAITWACSSAAQVKAIVTNEKIPAQDKKFMVRQEIADGAINVGILVTLSTLFQKAGREIVKHGLIPQQAIEDPQFGNHSSVIKYLKANLKSAADVKTLPECLQKYVKGMSVITALIGGILAVNVAAPILRNKIARMTDGYKKMPDLHNKEVSMFVDNQFKTFQNSVKIPQSIKKPFGTLNINFNKPGMKI